METLEALVRDSLVVADGKAPGAEFLLRAVRVGVARRRREHAAVAIGAVLGVAGLIIGLGIGLGRAPEPHATTLSEFGGHYPPVMVISPGEYVPPEVTAAAAQLSRAFVTHPPAQVVWVPTTINAWYRLERQSPVANDLPVYVVELRNAAPVACRTCKGLVTPVGRFGILVVPTRAGADGGEFVVTDTDYPLWEIGTEYMLDGAF